MFSKEQKLIIKSALKLMKSSTTGMPKLLDLINAGIKRGKLREHFGSLGGLLDVLTVNFPNECKACTSREQANAGRAKVIDKTKSLIAALGRFPTETELDASGVSRSAYRCHFSTLQGLFAAIKKEHSEIFLDLFSSSEFTDKRFKLTRERLASTDTFAISTVVSGCQVHEGAYEALEAWREANNAQTLFQPMADPARPKQSQDMFFDTKLRHDNIAFRDISLNDKVHVLSLLYSAKRINPHDSARRFVSNEALSIIASPKQKLTPRANLQGNPGYMFSPGAITVSDYTTEMYMSNGTAYMADRMHTMGAGIVKILGPNRYEFTNVEFDLDGSFAHDGKLYTPAGEIGAIETGYLFLPDLHFIEADPELLDEIYRIVEVSQPAEIFIQDAFSGVSINPFDRKSPMKLYHNRAIAKSLEMEVEDFGRKIEKMYDKSPDSVIQVVWSNHHLFLQYYIDSKRYADDVTNFQLGHQLAWIRLNDENADLLKAAFEIICPDVAKKVKINFLGPCESAKRYGVECNCHGHIGDQGKRNLNIDKLREDYGPCNAGHGHRSEISNGAIRVGTTEHLGAQRPAYARQGASSWSCSLVRAYSNGQRQLIHIVKGGAK